ncbi:hypothetical protein ACN9JG_04060 [Cereibacter azotoformans]|uniref:hypothetical protein n=1 Tax=Cereibacter azotoformans TaxID=43057 RepID=UPI003B2141B8
MGWLARIFGGTALASVGAAAPAVASGAPVSGDLPAGGRLPAELALSIEAATIVFRPGAGNGDEARVHVELPGVGRWWFDGIEDAAERIGRTWADVCTPAQLHRAARLLAAEVGRRNAQDFARGGRQRESWVTAPLRREW